MINNQTCKTLKQAKAGERVTVIRVAGEGALRQRILDMGLTKGAEVMVRKVAPLGDPIQILVRGYELTIRLEDAGKITMQEAAK